MPIKFPLFCLTKISCVLFASGCVAYFTAVAAQEIIKVPTGKARWLEVQQVKGKVTYQNRAAKVGDRLQNVGDGINTGSGSSALLAVDGGVAKVQVAANTNLSVRSLAVSPNGGKVTVLAIPKGQARLQVIPFNNAQSSFIVQTPAGVAGVRGTVFGVSVDPNGKTGISTLQGAVEASSENKSVLVNSGNSALMIPGKAPLAPRVTTVKLNLRVRVTRTSLNTVLVQGNIDPLNTLFIDGSPIKTSQDGKFKLQIPSRGRYRFFIRSPLGYQRFYDYGVR